MGFSLEASAGVTLDTGPTETTGVLLEAKGAVGIMASAGTECCFGVGGSSRGGISTGAGAEMGATWAMGGTGLMGVAVGVMGSSSGSLMGSSSSSMGSSRDSSATAEGGTSTGTLQNRN